MFLKIVCAPGVLVLGMVLSASASVKQEPWGNGPKGEPVHLYKLAAGGLNVELTDYGARIVRIDAPDRNGHVADITLGYNNLQQYEKDPKDYFGAVVGRYGNRIARGTYTIDGQTFHAPQNNNGNMLHGGTIGFDKKVWTGKLIGSQSVEFTIVSPDGDMGFPGELTAHVRYTLSGKSLKLEYSATTTRSTVVNLTNHAYFNLAGEGSGTILDQKLRINASQITPVATGLIPTGKLMPVAGTPFDFTKSIAIGQRIGSDDAQLKLGQGYDHNFVLNGKAGVLHEAAFAEDPASGRTLRIETTEPGIQFYSGNFLNGSVTGSSGKAYDLHGGFALETQHFPDSPNEPSFPSTTLRAGQEYHSTTVLTFGVAPAAS